MENAQGRRTFEFQQGPLFAHMILADHINRGTPKTQSALLEAMEGETVSVATEKFHLPQPYFVLATQNPLEMDGTFPLPEPELDRFAFKLLMPGASDAEVEQILDRTTDIELPKVSAVVDGRRILEMRQAARQVALPPAMRQLAVALTAATHPDHPRAPEAIRRYVRYGSSPRGAQAIVLGAKVQAAAGGRAEVSAADMHAVAHAALRHRLVLNTEGQAEDIRPDRLIDDILAVRK
jgi:MoxR-like ATPase